MIWKWSLIYVYVPFEGIGWQEGQLWTIQVLKLICLQNWVYAWTNHTWRPKCPKLSPHRCQLYIFWIKTEVLMKKNWRCCIVFLMTLVGCPQPCAPLRWPQSSVQIIYTTQTKTCILGWVNESEWGVHKATEKILLFCGFFYCNVPNMASKLTSSYLSSNFHEWACPLVAAFETFPVVS